MRDFTPADGPIRPGSNLPAAAVVAMHVVATVVAAVVTAGLLGSSAHAAAIEGRVVPPPARNESVAVNPYPGRAHTATPKAAGAAPVPFADIVVYLEGPIPGPRLRRNGPLELAQREKKFVPRVLPIVVGEKVSFPNFDPFYHNVFSYSPARRFDLGKYAEGRSDAITFPEPGEIRIFCDIHSEMNAVILVLENPYFAQPDAEGRFRIEGVPPGRYDLVVWHPDYPPQGRAVVVPSTEAAGLVVGF